jgi:ABC-type multidrug transport system fused ATPase/permease subunit
MPMIGRILFTANPLWIAFCILVILLIAEEIGFRVRTKTTIDSDTAIKSDIALILGAVLTLLALLLGFTYAMAQNRFEARRELVVEQANAIGTTYLRAKTLPSRSAESQKLLRQYVQILVTIGRTATGDPDRAVEWAKEAGTLHDLLWSHAIALAKENPQSPIVSIYLQSLNETIDLYSKRMAAYRNRVPASIYLVLLIVSVITLWLVGYYFGRKDRARILTMVVVVLLVSVMWLIMDLDQPARGAIRTSHQAVFDLEQDMLRDAQDVHKNSTDHGDLK